MSSSQWSLILLLAGCAYGLRFVGLLAGDWIDRRQKLKKLLDDLPGCLVVALVAASLAQGELAAWVTAPIALAVAIWRANVVLVMVVSMAFFSVFKIWIS